MKGVDAIKKSLAAIFFFMLGGDIWREPLIELDKLAKRSCKLFSHDVTLDPFLDLKSSKMEKMEDTDAIKNRCLVAIMLFLPVEDI